MSRPRYMINLIVVHCSATPPSVHVDEATIREWHTRPRSKGGRGWPHIGYHSVITRDGKNQLGRPPQKSGAHARYFNRSSLSICLVGGVNEDGEPENNFTKAQFQTLRRLLSDYIRGYTYRIERICGHRDLSPERDGAGVHEPGQWMEACPSFDVGEWVARNLPEFQGETK